MGSHAVYPRASKVARSPPEGKHNNWSLSTDTGKNLFSPGKTPAENKQFLLLLAAVVKAIDEYQDLLRASVASPGNDHRLGACEAPPAIVSMFLGEELDAVIDSIVSGTAYVGLGRSKMDLGVPSVPTFTRDTTDRNRTSPFAFTGNKFEFRMPGSSQNIAMSDIVLNTAVAESLSVFADELEAAEDFDSALEALLKKTFTEHRRVIWGGNGYSDAWKEEAERRGLLNLATSVEAYPCLTKEKNVNLFTKHGVMSPIELSSREEILFENYSKIINIEALTMLEMARRSYLPAVSRYLGELSDVMLTKTAALEGISVRYETEQLRALSAMSDEAYDAILALETAERAAAATEDVRERARAYAGSVCPAMQALRAKIDAMEPLVPANAWPVPGYGDLMFGV